VVFVYAIAQGIATSDPAEKLGWVLKPLRKGRQPTITDIVPLRKMILAAEEDNARPITRLGLRMLALTAVRPSELRGTEWAEFEDPRKSAIGWKTEITPSLRKAIKLRIEASGQHQKFIGPAASEANLL
jgi:integrase